MKKIIPFGLVFTIILASCGSPAQDSLIGDVDVESISQNLGDIQLLDLDAPLPSPGAAALRMLAEDEPGVLTLAEDVEAAERAAMEAAIAELQAQLETSGNFQDITPAGMVFFEPSILALQAAKYPRAKPVTIPADYQFQADSSSGGGGQSAAFYIGLLGSMFNDMLLSDLPPTPTQNVNGSHAEGNATTRLDMDFGRGEDGSTEFGMGFKSEVSKEGASAKAETGVKVKGIRCPDANGNVNFTITTRLSGEAVGAGITQDLTAKVTATVNDDAVITSSIIDVIQGTRTVKGGVGQYFESGMTVSLRSDYSVEKTSDGRLIRHSQNATLEVSRPAHEAGIKAALELGMGSLASARFFWKDGRCVKIEAVSPGTVEPGSITAIPVNVVVRHNRSEVKSKLKAELTGADSIDPTSLAKTPGTLTYTAPSEAGKSATILLTATSRRGIATLKLEANTGEKKQSYIVIETPGSGRSWKGACIDDLSKSFSLAWDGPGQDGSYNISPNSATSGNLTEVLHVDIGGTTMDYTGNGSYEIKPTNKDAEGNIIELEITYRATGTVKNCAAGFCVTSEMESGEGAQIPLRVQDGPCP